MHSPLGAFPSIISEVPDTRLTIYISAENCRHSSTE